MSQSTPENSKQLNYSCQFIESEEDLTAIKESWNNLADGLKNKSVFFRHEWYMAAWQWMCHETKLFTILIYQGSELVGACPATIRKQKYRGIRYNLLEFLAVPDTQLNDMLIKEGSASVVIPKIMSCLIEKKSQWDVMSFSMLYDNSTLYSNLPITFSNKHFNVRVEAVEDNLCVKLESNWENYYATRSRRLKKGNNHIANKLKKHGQGIEIVHFNSNNSELEINNALEEFITLSSKCWKNTTGLTLDNEKPKAFIKYLTNQARHNGWLSLWFLLLDKKYVAAEYQLEFNREIFALRADYDSDLEQLSPGTYLNWKLLIELFEKDLLCYSMGPGSNKYKLRWTDEQKTYHTVSFYNKNVKGTMLYWIQVKLKTFMKAIKVT